MEDNVIVKLDDLNPKQKLKEFKATQKELKSKELVAQQKGFDKIKDVRYLVEGGCLFPLVNSISTKKTLLDMSKLSLENLLGFFQNANKNDKTVIVEALKAINLSEGSLDVLKILSDLVNYREEVKKKKVPKSKNKNEVVVEEPIIENPVIVAMREISLKILYYITSALYSNFTEEYTILQKAVANIAQMTSNFGQLVRDLTQRLATLSAASTVASEITSRVTVFQHLEYALFSLVFLMKYDASSVSTLLMANTISNTSETDTPASTNNYTIINALHTLSSEPNFVFYCVQIFEIMSRVTDGLNTLQTQGNQALFITLLSNATNTLNEAVAALAVPVVKGKDVKKEVPKKGAAPVVEVIDPYTQIERIVIESKRQCVCIVKLISNIFIALSLFDKDYVTAESTATIASSVSKVVLNSILQTITRDALVHPLDCPVFDVINTACVLFGTLSKVNEALRVVVCDNGGLLAVCNVLLQSRNIICAINPIDPTAVIPVSTTPPLTAEEQEKQNTLRLNNLRRVCGKAVLHLLTAKRDSAPVEWSYSSESTPPARWESCSAYLTSVPHFQSVLTQIIEMIAAVDDADLVNRGVRVLSACLLSTENQTMMFDFIVASGVDSLVIAKLSNVLSLRGQSVVDHFVQKAASEATAAAAALTSGVEGSEPQEGEAVEQSLTGAVEGGVISADIAPLPASSLLPVETQDLLVPTIFDTYYLAWTIIESLLLCNNPLTTPDCLKALVTRDRVKVVSQTLAVMGSVSGSSVPTFEFSLPLYDPRVHNWYTTLDVNNTNSAQTADQTAYDSFRSDEVYLRTLILDTLALVPQMDAKYRTYESDVPVAPPLPLPPSKCSVEEAVLLICTGVADVTCGILLYQGAYKFNGSGNLVIVPAGEATNSLHLFSLNSSIKLLTAICSVGALGVTGALESIAENGFKSQLIDESSSLNVNLSSQQTLIKFLTTATNNTQIVPESHAWKRPLFYSDIFGGEEVLTSSARITENIALFPFITLTSSILCILSDPNIKGDTIIFALKTLFAMTKTNVWSETSQPVILDLLSTVFLSLSGGVTLASLVGRFGHVSEKDSMELEIGAFCRYLLSRGRDREAFWTQYAEENKPVEVIDPKTGKPIVKKEDKKPPPKDTKKIDPKAVIVVPVVSEILYNVESTVETPDPNKGPTAGYWTKLLDLSTDYDLHLNSSSTRVTVLTSAIQSLLTDIALLVIAQDVDVNFVSNTEGSQNITPLMYACCLQNSDVILALLTREASGADPNAIDAKGHSVLKYALMSMAPGEVDRVLCGHLDARFVADTAPWRVYGTAALLSLLLTTSAQHNLSLNINVRDSQGYSPVLLSLGLGGIELSVGGIPLSLQSHNSVENQDSDFLREDKSAYDDVQTMFEYRADMNACDLVGITPLHLAAARGDSKLISQLYSYSVTANVCDANGFLPLHYVSTCCPAVKLRETFDLLIQYGVEKPIESMNYNNNNASNTNSNTESQLESEFLDFLNSSFSEAFLPKVVEKSRVSYGDLLTLTTTNDKMNHLQLILSGHVLFTQDKRLNAFLVDNKLERMDFALYLLNCAKDNITTTKPPVNASINDHYKYEVNQTAAILLNNIDNYNMNILHTVSLCFQNTTEERTLTAAELRSKRVKSYGNHELQLLDIIYSHIEKQHQLSDYTFNYHATCDNLYSITKVSANGESVVQQVFTQPWTVLESGVKHNNINFMKSLIKNGFDLFGGLNNTKWVHFIATHCNPDLCSLDLCQFIIEQCANQPTYKQYLNESGDDNTLYNARPITLAVRAENVNLIRALVGTVKVDINSLDAVSNLSPFHEACLTQNVDIVRAFAQGVSRLDLLGAQSSGSEENCVEYVVRSGNVEMLKELIAMRRNDVIESLISHAYNSHASPLKEPPTASSAPSRKLTLDEDDMRMRGEEFRAHLEDIGEGELLVDVPLLLDTDPHPFDSLLLRLERRNLFLGRRIKATWASDEKLEGGDEVGGEGQSGYGRGGDDEEVGWNVGDRQAPETGGGGDDVIDALAGELDGLSFNPNGLKAAQDNSINAEPDPDALNTTVDGEVIAGVVIDPPLQVVTGAPEVDSPSGPPPLTFAEYLVTYEELQASNEVLRVVLDLVNGTGIVDASNHVCEQYFRGELMVLPDFE